MNDLGFLSIEDALKKLEKKELKLSDITDACIENIEETKDYNIYTEYDKDLYNQEGFENKLLRGLPAGVKDVFSTKKFHTTACSKILSGYKSPFNAVSIDRILDNGASIIGKLNTDEFTCGCSTESSCYGPTKNPYDKERVSGGSSGGSAAAVAMGTCLFSLGTDTGGSIRQPASFCNVVGLKVTYGRVPRTGVISMASSFDTIGPMARTVKDTAIALSLIAGKSDLDGTTPDVPVQDYLKNLEQDIAGKKIGIPEEYFGEGVDESTSKLVMEAISVLEKKGVIIKKVSLPHTKYGVSLYYILTPAEVSSNMSRYDGIRFGKNSEEASDLIDSYYKNRGQGFGDEMKRRILMGTYVLSAGYYDAYYRKAQKIRTLVLEDFQRAFQDVDALVGPISPFSAFKVGELTNDPLANYKADVLTIPANCAGLPAISVPCGFDNKKMPVGLQIIGSHFREDLILNIANIYEKETEFYKKRPF